MSNAKARQVRMKINAEVENLLRDQVSMDVPPVHGRHVTSWWQVDYEN
jgi:hypothetical protein